MLEDQFFKVTRPLKEFYGQQWKAPRLKMLLSKCKSKYISHINLADAIEDILRTSNTCPKVDTVINKALKFKRKDYQDKQTAKLMKEEQENDCKACINTGLVECRTEDKSCPVVFAGCPDCDRDSGWDLPRYSLPLVVVDILLMI
jgi:hypothetical protein